MQTTAIRTVANSLPENEVILLTLLISKRYIPYTDLQKQFVNGINFHNGNNKKQGLSLGQSLLIKVIGVSLAVAFQLFSLELADEVEVLLHFGLGVVDINLC